MRTYTNIANTSSVYSPAGIAPAPRPYASAGVGQHFGDVYRQQAQEGLIGLDRGNTKMAGDYYSNAQQAQNQSVLAGLGLRNTQKQNAWQRQNAQQQMAYGLMNDITGGMGGAIGGVSGLLRGLL